MNGPPTKEKNFLGKPVKLLVVLGGAIEMNLNGKRTNNC